MAATDTSLELLAHFDGPARQETAFLIPTRGVGWVMQWAAAIATLCIAIVWLTHFGYCLAAERTLTRAARAGALEATLPRATHHSVAKVIERHRAANFSNRLRFSLHQNGAPVRGAIQSINGDRLTVTLTVPTHELLPRWLRIASIWPGDSQIAVRAERRLPGRRLRDR